MTILSNIIAPTNILSETNTATVSNKTISGSSNTLSNLDAANLSSGTVPTTRLGSGTANSTTFLRGDNTWAAVAAGGGEWTYIDQYTGAYSNTSQNLLSHITGGLISHLNAHSSVKLSIKLENNQQASNQAINPRLYYYRNGGAENGKSFLQYGVPTTSTGYYVGRESYNNTFTILNKYVAYNLAFIELYFFGEYLTTFANSESPNQLGYAYIAGNQTNTNYGPITQETTFQPSSGTFSTTGNFTDFQLRNGTNAVLRSTVEVYVK
jgi:hypothetical protein